MKQRESAAKATPSPGPAYEPKSTRRGPMDLAAAYSFGNEIRIKNRDASLRTPGPGVYNAATACGGQVQSTNRSAPTACFGQPSVNSGGRGILPLEGRHSPGPIYMNAAACKKQQLSTKRSANTQAFGRAQRFGANYYGGGGGPGPGEYIV